MQPIYGELVAYEPFDYNSGLAMEPPQRQRDFQEIGA